jgi:hypothetical protein
MAWAEGPGAHVGQGNIRPANARELIALLGTADEGLRFRSATELPGLDLIVNWAKKTRLVRKQGTHLVPVARARPLLADAEALWQRVRGGVRPWRRHLPSHFGRMSRPRRCGVFTT